MWTAVLYDINNTGYISEQEMNDAMNDWRAGKISYDQLQEVTNAYVNNVNLKEWVKQNIDYSFVSKYDTDSSGYILYQEFSVAESQYQKGEINYVQYAMVAAAYKYGLYVKAEPKFELRNLRVYMDGMQIDPATTTIPLGKTITVNVELWNTGNVAGRAIIYYTINGKEVATGFLDVKPGKYIPFGADVIFTKTGIYRICLGFI